MEGIERGQGLEGAKGLVREGVERFAKKAAGEVEYCGTTRDQADVMKYSEIRNSESGS